MTDPTWEQVDADTYRCTRCGVQFPAGRKCQCAVGDSPGTAGVPHTTETLKIKSVGAGESPTVDRVRREQWRLYLETRAIARAACKTLDAAELRRNSTAGKLFEIARKALDSCYASARDAEIPETLDRYEALAARIVGKGQLSNRRAHSSEERGN